MPNQAPFYSISTSNAESTRERKARSTLIPFARPSWLRDFRDVGHRDAALPLTDRRLSHAAP